MNILFPPTNTLTLNAFPWIQSSVELFTFAYFFEDLVMCFWFVWPPAALAFTSLEHRCLDKFQRKGKKKKQGLEVRLSSCLFWTDAGTQGSLFVPNAELHLRALTSVASKRPPPDQNFQVKPPYMGEHSHFCMKRAAKLTLSFDGRRVTPPQSAVGSPRVYAGNATAS